MLNGFFYEKELNSPLFTPSKNHPISSWELVFSLKIFFPLSWRFFFISFVLLQPLRLWILHGDYDHGECTRFGEVRQYSSLAVALMALSCSFKSSQHVSWGTGGRKGSGLHQKGRTDRRPKGHLKTGGNQPASVSLDKNFYKIAFFRMMPITFRFNN